MLDDRRYPSVLQIKREIQTRSNTHENQLRRLLRARGKVGNFHGETNFLETLQYNINI